MLCLVLEFWEYLEFLELGEDVFSFGLCGIDGVRG